MQLLTWKNSFLACSLVLLTACSTTSQAQNQNSQTVAETNHQQHMDHGGMNHNMVMDLGPADANYDLRFIDAMIPHHEAAVIMAKDALQKSQRLEIKNLTQAIIKGQNSEVNQMKQWRTTWYKSSAS